MDEMEVMDSLPSKTLEVQSITGLLSSKLITTLLDLFGKQLNLDLEMKLPFPLLIGKKQLMLEKYTLQDFLIQEIVLL